MHVWISFFGSSGTRGCFLFLSSAPFVFVLWVPFRFYMLYLFQVLLLQVLLLLLLLFLDLFSINLRYLIYSLFFPFTYISVIYWCMWQGPRKSMLYRITDCILFFFFHFRFKIIEIILGVSSDANAFPRWKSK